MKTETFKRKDGTSGISYKAEAGDIVTALSSQAGERENLAIVKGQAKKIMSYFLSVELGNGDKVILTLTGGQKKKLDKLGDLMNKKISFYIYKNSFGDQVGCKLV